MGTAIKMGRGVSRANAFLNTTANYVGVFAIFILMFLITADVAGRYLFNTPVRGTYDIGQSLVVVAAFFCFAYAQRKGAHIRITSLVQLFPQRSRLVVEIFYQIVGLCFFACVTYSTWQGAATSLRKGESFLTLFYFDYLIPIYPSKFVVSIGSALMCLQFCVGITRKIAEFVEARGEVSP
jgi:TRAP-type C4-dicarboxylate transport system permease small subunit